jgi:hypothetical protein
MKVSNSARVGNVLPRDDASQNNLKRNRREKRREIEKAKSHLNELIRAAEEADRELENRHLPYRFCIWEEGDEVFMDFAIIGEESEISTKNENGLEQKYSGCLKVFLKEGSHIGTFSRKNITNKSFSECLEMFQSGLGLLLNKRA